MEYPGENKKNWMRPVWRRLRAPLGLSMLIWLAAAATITNPAGGTADLLTNESDASSVQSSPAGGKLELVSTDQTCMDAVAPSGAWCYLGLIDPVEKSTTGANRVWVMYE